MVRPNYPTSLFSGVHRILGCMHDVHLPFLQDWTSWARSRIPQTKPTSFRVRAPPVNVFGCSIAYTAMTYSCVQSHDPPHHHVPEYVSVVYATQMLSETDYTPVAVPVVAVINGHGFAGGMVLAMACDYRVMTDGSKRNAWLCMNEVSSPRLSRHTRYEADYPTDPFRRADSARFNGCLGREGTQPPNFA